ncbi:Uncharacterised protein [Mycobacterium tuberculosis]|uniref:Uncharacterized protein n=1 Tax=Mycobacterium tuberculosis TaxID=1773 RepID=A0A654TZT0_MYCTX|nr:Uncharacterised protein [Mycobacterium tuberculosis]CNL61559.1 Uncharacterised protein [Mycobacterium tuberculosis]CNL97672.1 Uncharacterised protein [Mycobacterium tuberculosis]CNM63324.1 Uncharacterised protein [Mycobacterium tuberculosis]COX20479.1 Uncharacterised protein [Mycobacterium tuberculosis]
MIIKTSGRLSDSRPTATPVPAPSASNAWMYWLIRSASWPPVSLVSPRNSTGLFWWRLSAPTSRWPLWVGLRNSSPEQSWSRMAPLSLASWGTPTASLRPPQAGGTPTASSPAVLIWQD